MRCDKRDHYTNLNQNYTERDGGSFHPIDFMTDMNMAPQEALQVTDNPESQAGATSNQNTENPTPAKKSSRRRSSWKKSSAGNDASSKKKAKETASKTKEPAPKTKRRNKTELLEMNFQSILEETDVELMELAGIPVYEIGGQNITVPDPESLGNAPSKAPGKKGKKKKKSPATQNIEMTPEEQRFELAEAARSVAPRQTEKLLKEELPNRLFDAWCEYLSDYEPNIRNSIAHVIERRLRRMKIAIPLDYRNREDEEEDDPDYWDEDIDDVMKDIGVF